MGNKLWLVSHSRYPVGIWAPTPYLETALPSFIFTSPAVLAHCCSIYSCYLHALPLSCPPLFWRRNGLLSCGYNASAFLYSSGSFEAFKSKWVKDVLKKNIALGMDLGGVPTTENNYSIVYTIHQYISYLVVSKTSLSTPFTIMPCLHCPILESMQAREPGLQALSNLTGSQIKNTHIFSPY